MFLVSQGAFLCCPSRACQGEGCAGARPSLMAAQGWMLHRAARCRQQPLGAAVSQRQDLSLGRGSTPSVSHTLGFTPGLPPPPSPIKRKDALQPLSISVGTPGTVLQPLVFLCCQSLGCLKDDSQFTELFCMPAHPGKDTSSLFPTYQPGFSSLTSSRGCIRVGKQAQNSSKMPAEAEGLNTFSVTQCPCSDSCQIYPGIWDSISSLTGI